jgi:hypothetical protein
MVLLNVVEKQKILVIKCPKTIDFSYYSNLISKLYGEEKKYTGYHLFFDLTDLEDLNVNLAGIAEAINFYRSIREFEECLRMVLLVPPGFVDTIKKVQESVSEEHYDQLVSGSIDECAAFLGVERDVLT